MTKKLITITMPKKSLAKWLKALRSGAYKQGNGTLANVTLTKFCCLGVLQHCLTGEVERLERGGARERIAVLPTLGWLLEHRISFRWRGNQGLNPWLPLLGCTASYANDQMKAPFTQIADAIEACAKGI